ncbi:MAG: MarR family transcriptional regulator [Lachnospiraceae bacterium]|nr:MarR family transcriptional regulator [Lachnospiraceae bacterium]
MDITSTLNEVLVKLFRDINTIEEKAIKTGEYKELTVNDMHVIEAIDKHEPKNMTTVAKSLSVTTGTLTISVNGLVKKGYVERIRSEEDRRVVLISLTEKGRRAFAQHQRFHQEMIDAVVEGLSIEEQVILEQALRNVNQFFRTIGKKVQDSQ